eukprot:TRINITY_DN9320_c0_g6_i1.p2 TRINITY_DN9320_c0_g6~~TRINITY_DN9320_c0_g6_i1.p2  ORF type:complete len:150 (+),score=24.53 TRINITY_DN9320_c0_g6_i1:223-672(+)
MLKKNERLATLNLSDNNMGDKVIKDICEALKANKSMKQLGVSNFNIKVDGIKIIAKLLATTLTTLDIDNNKLKDEDIKAFVPALKANKSLVSLDISRNSFQSLGAKHIYEAFKTNKVLKKLNLSFNRIGREASVKEFLKVNKTVESLNL